MVISRTGLRSVTHRAGVLLGLGGSLLLAAGCGIAGPNAVDGTVAPQLGVAFGGTVHGGQQPVIGATIKLWNVGKTGYGSTATLLATATTGADGSFAFQAGGASNYTCPSSTTVPLTYLTASGGDAGAGQNSAISMLAILAGPTAAAAPVSQDLCGTVFTQKPFVVINEVSTVVAINAMSQFYNPTTSMIGTTAGNLVGLTNAINNAASIMSINTGLANATYTPYGAAYGLSTHNQINATPEVQKINLIANILAACVNSTGSTSMPCTTLFADAVPPPTPSTTTLGSTFSFPAATDTLRAAYYLAANPINATTAGTADTAKQTELFNLSTATPPFPTSVTSAPTDWTLAVTFSSSAVDLVNNYILSAPTSVAIDGQGDPWMLSTTSATAQALTVLTPFGGLGLSRYDSDLPGLGIALDPGGGSVSSPTFNGYVGRSTGSGLRPSYEIGFNSSFTPGSAMANFTDAQTGAGNTASVAGISYAGDGVNMYFPNLSNGYVYEVPNVHQTGTPYTAAATAVPETAINNGHAISGFTTATGTAVDQTGHVWVTAPAGNSVYSLAYPAAPVTTGNAVTPVAYSNGLNAPTAIAIDHSNNAWVVNGTGGTPASGYVAQISAAGAITADTVNGHGGINNPTGVAIDGSGNVWVSSAGTSGSFAGQTVSELALVGATLTALSPSAGFAHSYGGPGSLAVDLSGNVWVTNSGVTATSSVPGSVTMLLGVASPTVNTLALGVSKGTLATTPQ